MTNRVGLRRLTTYLISPDGAECCEIVGLYLLYKISSTLDLDPNHNGLYRDDGLIAVPKANGRKMDIIRKKLHKLFKDEGLKIVVQTDLVVADSLDVTLNLNDGTYKPFRKPNDTPSYIHKDSNHPPSIKKNLVPMINNRLNSISSNETVFNDGKHIYQEALKNLDTAKTFIGTTKIFLNVKKQGDIGLSFGLTLRLMRVYQQKLGNNFSRY